MQSLTESPREELTETQVRELLTGDDVTVSAGCELLNGSNVVIEDLGDVFEGGEVQRDNYATVHGSCTLRLARPLAWGRDRVRPYMTLSNEATTARFNLGVYVLTTPDTERGEDPVTYEVQGWDLLHLLQASGPGDTYVIEPSAGANEVANPSFEVDTTGWESNEAFGAYTACTFARSTTRASDGAASLEVTWPGATSWVNTGVNGLTVGKTYRFRADVWVPSSHSGELALEVLFRTNSGPTANLPRDQWVTLELTYTTDATDLFIGLQCSNNTNGDKVWLDNVRWEALTTTYIQALDAVLTFSGVGATWRLSGDRIETAVAEPMVWALTDSVPVSWLRIVNDLLAAIAYRSVYANQDGELCSEPYVPPGERGVEWTFDVEDPGTTIVHPDRTMSQDVWRAPNWWRFIRTGMSQKPVEGAGIYTVTNQSTGVSSIDQLGRQVRKVVFLDVADQAALVTQGDRIVAEDVAVSRTHELSVDPLPIAGHFDVVRYVDGDRDEKCQVRKWELPLDGSSGTWVLEALDG